MRLQSIGVARFRSVECAVLDGCSSFNVLIGKNNSGKSNLLTAISAFFDGVGSGHVVSINPSIGKEIDFFERKTDQPIEVETTFSLSLAERDALVRDIVTDAPQLKTAVDGLDPTLRVRITWAVTPPPTTFAYVSTIALVDPQATQEVPASRVLLRVGSTAASELRDQLLAVQQIDNDLKTLDRVQETPDFWRRTLRDTPSERPPLRYLIDRFERPDSMRRRSSATASRSTEQALEQAIEDAANYDDLKSSFDAIRQDLESRAETLRNQSLANKVVTFAGEELSVPAYATALLKRVADMSVLHLQERRDRIGTEEAQRLLELKVSRGGEQVLSAIQETVSALLGVRIDAFRGSSSAIQQTSAELDVDNFLVQVNGAGIREALRVVLDYEFQRPQILLVEEPEIYLHPALEMNMMRYLKSVSNRCQVFITTHSTNFLDMSDMKNVYLISKSSSTKIRPIDYSEAQDRVPKELGMRLSSFFMYDRLVFVEGPSDEMILREFSSKIGANLAQANVGFVRMGGARNFAYYATESSIDFLSKRQVEMWFILDRDEREDRDLDVFFEKLGSHANVRILSRREIENYLLVPAAISKFVALKRGLANGGVSGHAPSEIDVQGALETHADRFRQVVIGKRVAAKICLPIYPKLKGVIESTSDGEMIEVIRGDLQRMSNEIQNHIGMLDEIHQEVATTTEKDWNLEKLNAVQGDMLLDKVCSEFGVRFIKNVDGPRIAALLDPNEIDKEIQDILREIVE